VRSRTKRGWGPHPTYTVKRHSWLAQLADEPTRRSGQGRTAFDCMELGWTEWAYRDREGNVLNHKAAREKYGDAWNKNCEEVGEMLTTVGREILTVWDRRPGSLSAG